jgi:uncharacterized PurR-regulated membrane protein YhhQ (DUF165 family)
MDKQTTRTITLIGSYLLAIVAANLLVVTFGPGISMLNAFLFIGLDLTARDGLHETWHQKGLVWKMGLLIGSGSILSWLLNANAGMIAIASFTSFALAGIVDTIIFQRMFSLGKLVRINGSNVGSALIDSIAFPAIAFGFPLLIGIMVGQFIAKVGGGFVWSLILSSYDKKSQHI